MKTLLLLVSLSLLAGCGTSAYLVKIEGCEQLGAKYLHCDKSLVEELD
jgi:hypothetical protein